MRCTLALSLGLAPLLLSASASAAPDDSTTSQCLTAYEDGQRARKRGDLSESRTAFRFCSSPTCPSALHGDCEQWLHEVDEGIPSGIFRVLDPSGKALSRVVVRIDGVSEAPLTGQVIELNPGQHELEFMLVGYETKTLSVAFTEGDKRVQHDVVLSPIPVAKSTVSASSVEPERPATEQHSTLPGWIGAGIGVVGLAGFTYYGLSAREKDRALSMCAPNCTLAQADEVEREYLIANLSLGVGVLGVLGAVSWLVFSTESNTSATPDTTAIELHVGPTTRLVGRF